MPTARLKKGTTLVGRSTKGLRPKLWPSANSCLDLNFAPTRFLCVLEASPASLDAPHNSSHPIPSQVTGMASFYIGTPVEASLFKDELSFRGSGCACLNSPMPTSQVKGIIRGYEKEAEIIGWPTNELNVHIQNTGSRAHHINSKDLLYLKFILTLPKFYSHLELAIELR